MFHYKRPRTDKTFERVRKRNLRDHRLHHIGLPLPSRRQKPCRYFFFLFKLGVLVKIFNFKLFLLYFAYSLEISLLSSLYIYIYIYICMYVCMYVLSLGVNLFGKRPICFWFCYETCRVSSAFILFGPFSMIFHLLIPSCFVGFQLLLFFIF